MLIVAVAAPPRGVAVGRHEQKLGEGHEVSDSVFKGRAGDAPPVACAQHAYGAGCFGTLLADAVGLVQDDAVPLLPVQHADGVARPHAEAYDFKGGEHQVGRGLGQFAEAGVARVSVVEQDLVVVQVEDAYSFVAPLGDDRLGANDDGDSKSLHGDHAERGDGFTESHGVREDAAVRLFGHHSCASLCALHPLDGVELVRE